MKRSLLILTLLTLCGTSVASINGSLTTLFYNRENFVERFEKPRSFTLYEYLLINASKLAGDRVNLRVSLRFGGNLNDGRLKARLFPSYLTLKAPHGFKVRLGRQFLPNEAGLFEIDGVRVDKVLGSVSLSLFGGSSFIPLSIRAKRRASLGGSVDFGSFRKLRARVGLFPSFDGEGLKRLILSGHLGSFRPGFHGRRRFNAFFGFGYDLISMELSRLYLTTDFAPLSNLSVYAGYRHYKPLLSPDSIFSVFSNSSSDEISIEAEYTLGENLSLYTSYTGFLGDGGLNHGFNGGIYLAGLSVGFEELRGEMSQTRIKLSLEKMIRRRLSLSLGTYYNVYDIGKRYTAFSALTGLGYSFRNLSFSINAGYNKNPYYRYNLRFLGRLRLNFAYQGKGHGA
jgi:hypothetical protein